MVQSADLTFLLFLVLRMAVAAAFVIAASIVTERSGPVIGALVATLPVSAGPAYIFLALDHDAAFIADAALASLPLNATTIFMGLAYVTLAQRHSMAVSLAGGIAVWLAAGVIVGATPWSLTGGIVANLVAFAVCLPLVQRFRVANMPLITRRWFDIPLRAALVATVVATVVTVSNTVGPKVSGIIALFPVVFSSLILILHPRIGGPATAAVFANGLFGLIGFGAAIAVLHLGARGLGSAAGLSLALATGVAWNLGLWLYGRKISSSSRP
jgi:uncharacterized membrane protein (GlpM family)